MKNLRNDEVVVTQSVVTDLICNCCGRSIDVEHTMGTDINEVAIHFGYGSRFDLSIWEMDICDDCLDNWRATFKHPVNEKPYMLA